jgi:hypothetical protein
VEAKKIGHYAPMSADGVARRPYHELFQLDRSHSVDIESKAIPR